MCLQKITCIIIYYFSWRREQQTCPEVKGYSSGISSVFRKTGLALEVGYSPIECPESQRQRQGENGGRRIDAKTTGRRTLGCNATQNRREMISKAS